jgi:hypothetical protein
MKRFLALPLSLIIVSITHSGSYAQNLMQSEIDAFSKLPPATTCRTLPYDTVQIVPGIVPGTWFATVRGSKPLKSMDVRVVPVAYVRQPEYWLMEVVGCYQSPTLQITGSYSVVADISTTRGKKGIEIRGANKSEKFEVPPK